LLRRKAIRPLAIEGRSGSGKTQLLRELWPEAQLTRWSSARDLIDEAVEAVRADRYAAFEEAMATDERPLVVEHIEDLRAKPRTREELKRALCLRAAGGRPTVLTLTTGRGRSEIVRWLGRWADLTSLDPRRRRPAAQSVRPRGVELA
jgi:chromosomal replication initiation ATPase DnaA